MELKINMKLDNSAFDYEDAPEIRCGHAVASVLEKLASQIEGELIHDGDTFLERDVNGNTVLTAEIVEETAYEVAERNVGGLMEELNNVFETYLRQNNLPKKEMHELLQGGLKSEQRQTIQLVQTAWDGLIQYESARRELRRDRSRMTSEEYAENEGQCCPYCRSEELDWSWSDQGGVNSVEMNVGCKTCGKKWVSYFHLAGYESND